MKPAPGLDTLGGITKPGEVWGLLTVSSLVYVYAHSLSGSVCVWERVVAGSLSGVDVLR